MARTAIRAREYELGELRDYGESRWECVGIICGETYQGDSGASGVRFDPPVRCLDGGHLTVSGGNAYQWLPAR